MPFPYTHQGSGVFRVWSKQPHTSPVSKQDQPHHGVGEAVVEHVREQVCESADCTAQAEAGTQVRCERHGQDGPAPHDDGTTKLLSQEVVTFGLVDQSLLTLAQDAPREENIADQGLQGDRESGEEMVDQESPVRMVVADHGAIAAVGQLPPIWAQLQCQQTD
eukprot:CAMPEP_0206495112 /NCGR_PEP_ID=MMETSP0324_2-20121206/48235_1 /ASSEMBLY_ACC=CAM_ASM_000836 /TAXON_ID=2866 /ORGANISM="Crypthecodinium cohnii, Strain Seligo" /LENGTH=162 /DNA_ID=CAMNT_0053979107 /DNA_START=309 /DNA_END=798 /DNA_ORIENTATION=+